MPYVCARYSVRASSTAPTVPSPTTSHPVSTALCVSRCVVANVASIYILMVWSIYAVAKWTNRLIVVLPPATCGELQ